jgi:predicted MFS family arabinose efflux permease
MLSSGSIVWKLGLIPESVANGLTTILVLFFLLANLHGTLLDVGLVTGVTALALIPSQMIWGRMIDGTGMVKPFLILGFLGMGLSTIAIPWAGSVTQLLAIVTLKSVSLAATVPARQLLTVESEHRDGWLKGLANMQFLTALGETAGMGLGAVSAGLSFSELFPICGALCITSAVALGVLVQEPGLMIQRRLVALERSVGTIMAVSDFAGYPRLSAGGGAIPDIAGMLGRSTKYLLLGIFCFSLAGSAFYSPLPAYFLRFYSSQAVFVVFFGGSLAGAVAYLLIGRLFRNSAKSLFLSSSMRIVVLPLLVLAALGGVPGLAAAALILALLEVLWSLFDVSSTFAFLQTAKMGQAGFYGALVGLGSAGGGFLGGFYSMQFGFASLFILCGALCAVALAAFVVQYRGSGGYSN